jgi:hypothetical protein
MPITRTADEKTRTLLSKASGPLSYEDFTLHIEEKIKSGVLNYAELFDARGANLDLSLSELHSLSEQMRRAIGKTKPGRIAVVTDSAFIAGLARAYQTASREHNPGFEIFGDCAEARTWLAGDSPAR